MQTDIQVVGDAGSGKEALRLCTETAPDVALVDLLLGQPAPLPDYADAEAKEKRQRTREKLKEQVRAGEPIGG